ncbi:MAG: hypothetical protein JO056_02965 [Alphaproteobacteria bacterium]|nr:hypothetical protein [Alphaproteobacteria bacterium]
MLFRSAIFASAMIAVFAPAAQSSTYTQIFKFSAEIGRNPYGRPVQDKEGALYGTAHFSGPDNSGVVFKLAPPAEGKTKWTHIILHTFAGGDDGNGPVGGLVKGKSGALYGTTVVGGADNYGTVFRLIPPAEGQQDWAYKVIYSFPVGDGFPNGNLLIDETGNLYGTTSLSVFRLSPGTGDLWTASTLYTFGGGADGAGPTGGLAGNSTELYGTTRAGGGANKGIVYKLVPPESGDGLWTKEILHDFNGFDGSGPNGDLVLKNGRLFGTTAYGGDSDMGTVFEMRPPQNSHTGWKQIVIHSFAGIDGHLPYNGLTSGKNGVLYGTTVEGGEFGKHGWGVVFRLTPPTAPHGPWIEDILHSFDNKDGNSPGLPLLDKSGTLYGGTQYGSSNNTGTMFQITP